MTTIHETPDGEIHAYMKGAPEVVLERCDFIWDVNGPRPITEEDKARILKVNEEMASSALRNLAIAFKKLEGKPGKFDEDLEKGGFVFLGITGMIDPAREEVKDAIKLCKSAGIKTVMITGDHKLTAVAIAKDLEMDVRNVLTGAELDKISDEEFKKMVDEVTVYARVSPAHKVRILEAFKERGHVVAMTGDGVNDAPALKRADIGIAMGITGTDVSKEASDMVLADDNFATIVAAVEEGRRIVDNIKKYLVYLMQCNIAEILVMVVAFILGLPLPLTPAQILWVNLTTDGLPALALGVDPAEPDVMKRPPMDPREAIFSKEVKLYLTIVPIVITGIWAYVYLFFLDVSYEVAMSTLFLTVIFTELAVALTCHSLNKPLYAAGAFTNKFLWIAVISQVIVTLPLFYVPALYTAFHVVPVGLESWLWAIASAASIFVGLEVAKIVAYRMRK